MGMESVVACFGSRSIGWIRVDGPQTVVVIYVAGLFIGLVRVKVDENTVESVCFRVIDAEMYHHV